MARTPIAARLAWRDLMGHRRRFALSVALFSLPIACIVAFFTLISSESVEYADMGDPATSISVTNKSCNDDPLVKNKDWCLGPDHGDRADLPDRQRINNALGNDPELISKVYASLGTYATINVNGEQVSSDMVSQEIDPSGPKPGEVLLDKDIAELMGVSPGDTVTVAVPVLGNMEEQKELLLTVAGFAQTKRNIANYGDLSHAVGITDSVRQSELGHSAHLNWRSDERLSVATEPGMGMSISPAEQGESPRSGTVVGEVWSQTGSIEAVVIGVVLTVLLLFLAAATIGPIFAVSARRKRRMLGLYASIGATPNNLLNAVLMEGIIVSCIGYVLGLIISLPVFYAVTLLPGVDGAHLRWAWDVALVLLPAVFISGVGAALIPAAWAGLENPVQALADGTSRDMRRFHWMMALPLLLFIPITILAALRQQVFSSLWWNLAGIDAILCAPLMVWVVARCGAVLPLSGKLAARDALRNIHRTAPAVAAVSSTVYGCAMLVWVTGSGFAVLDIDDVNKTPIAETVMVAQAEVDTATPRPYEQDVHAVREHYDVKHHADVYGLSKSYGFARTLLKCAYGDESNLSQVKASTEYKDSILLSSDFGISDSCMIIAEPDYLDTVASSHPNQVTPEQLAAAKQALSDGKAVADNAHYIRDGKVRIDTYNNSELTTAFENYHADDGWVVSKRDTEPDNTTLLDAVPLNNAASSAGKSSTPMIITPETARKLGADIVYTGSVFELSEPLSLGERIRIEMGTPHGVQHMTVTLPGSHNAETFIFMLPQIAVSGALAMGVVLLIVLLAAAESRRDMETMAALGAPKSLVRRYAGAQGMVVGLAGVVTGTLCMVIPGTVSYLSNVQFFGGFARWEPQYIGLYGLLLLSIVGISWLVGALFGVRSVSDYPCRR